MTLTIPTYLDTAAHIPGFFGYTGAPDTGLTMFPRVYEVSLATSDADIAAILAPHLASNKSGLVVLNAEWFSADAPPSLNDVARFGEICDQIRKLSPAGTKLYVFGFTPLGNSFTDPVELNKVHRLTKSFLECGVAQHIDGIVPGAYATTGGDLHVWWSYVQTFIGLCAEWGLPLMLYVSPWSFGGGAKPAPSPASTVPGTAAPAPAGPPRLTQSEFEYVLSRARVLVDQKQVQSIGLYTMPMDGSTQKWGADDDAWLASVKTILG